MAKIIDVANDLEALLQQADRTYRVIQGDPGSRVVLHVPHASRVIPPDVRGDILLDDDALERELDAMTDAFTDVIAERSADLTHLRPWIFVNETSRLVVDPERFPDETEEMNAVGMGAIYTRTSTGAGLRDDDAAADPTLLEKYFEPYAEALTRLVDERLRAAGQVIIVDLHSYPLEPLPYELHDGPRPEVCLGTDDFHTPDALVDTARAAFSSFETDFNTPFAGCYIPLTHYRSAENVHGLMIELRRDLYLDESFALVEPAVEPIAQAVATLLDDVDLGVIITCEGMNDVDGQLVVEEDA
ncbi:N-formylglutamate amidohydrolase [Aeromicrobium sp. CFBP 8757]|nr:N-formylglutamate amidohydrolase [Aeromicrobium sp. CFBP 8757]